MNSLNPRYLRHCDFLLPERLMFPTRLYVRFICFICFMRRHVLGRHDTILFGSAHPTKTPAGTASYVWIDEARVQ